MLWNRIKRGLAKFTIKEEQKGVSHQGLLVFAHTGEVIAAESALRAEGFVVEVKGPPPSLHTGCDMVIVFDMVRQMAVKQILEQKHLEPLQIVTVSDTLLEPVNLYNVVDYGAWLMVRAANMKITVQKDTKIIVNISGGGCPDVPYLAQYFTGKSLDNPKEPRHIGQTLCCYSLQKAFEEARRLICG